MTPRSVLLRSASDLRSRCGARVPFVVACDRRELRIVEDMSVTGLRTRSPSVEGFGTGGTRNMHHFGGALWEGLSKQVGWHRGSGPDERQVPGRR